MLERDGRPLQHHLSSGCFQHGSGNGQHPNGRNRAVRPRLSLQQVFAGYRSLLGNTRGARTYSYVFLNAVLHSGVYTWLGLYFTRRYQLDEVALGMALLGYGVPGMIMGPSVGRAADRWGRRWLVPSGFAIAAGSAGILILKIPVVAGHRSDHSLARLRHDTAAASWNRH